MEEVRGERGGIHPEQEEESWGGKRNSSRRRREGEQLLLSISLFFIPKVLISYFTLTAVISGLIPSVARVMRGMRQE